LASACRKLYSIITRLFSYWYFRSRKSGGSGLGFVICKHIIEAHNQTIYVRSKIDVGSTFGFTLQSKKD
jgi:two-component system, OmpR family, phosphate regulon sensor histidine kinase PhoR